MWVSKTSDRLPIKSWCDNIESQAMQQAINLAGLPFAFRHIALMPDCHSGYGMPIGGVLATQGVVIPYAVGVDIGCGMCAVQTSLLVEEHAGNSDAWKRVMGHIRSCIPMGRGHREDAAPTQEMPSTEELFTRPHSFSIVAQEFDAARHQLGTLGGGNHFIEIQKGSDGHIWVMLHSGSRNVGYRVAHHYHSVAQVLNERWKSSVPKSHQLSFLPLDTQEGQQYLDEMQWCVAFALRNRYYMMDQIQSCIQVEFDATFDRRTNIAHNYAVLENHFGQNVVVHRKGATRARKGDIGIIPGSMGTASYIVEGLGNPESFDSCSHGAGRTMSRSAAKDRLDLGEQQTLLDSQGIIHGVRQQSDLDEAPGAYKDIRSVMEQQSDLVTPIVELLPIAVLKG